MKEKKWKLIYKDTKKEVKNGDILTSFRCEKYEYVTGMFPHKLNSTGLVYVKRESTDKINSAYFPQVFNLKWVKE